MSERTGAGQAAVWGARITAVFLLAVVGAWVHTMGGVSSSPDILADGSNSTDRLFNWHPVLMVSGFGVLMTEAVLAYRAPGKPTHTRDRRKIVHWSLHSIAVVLISFGLLAVWRSHDLKDPPIPNLYSPHSYLGLSVICLLSLQFLAGFYSYLWPKTSMEQRAALSPYHRFLGLVVYLAALAAMATGLQEKATFLQAFGKHSVYSSFIQAPAVAELLLLLLAALVAGQFALFSGPSGVRYNPVHLDEESRDGNGD